MRNPSSMGTNLPTVEDRSVGSDGTSNTGASSRVGSLSGSLGGSENNMASAPGAPRMKRSPYLSVMAGSTKESEDLVAMLSRPTPGAKTEPGTGHSQGSHGGSHQQQGHPSPGGRSSFFDLKRPCSANPVMTQLEDMAISPSPSHTVTPVSSAGGEIAAEDEGSGEGASGANQGNNVNASEMDTAQPMHHPNPAARPMPSLRSALRMGSRSDMKALSSSAKDSELRKNTSVTFSNTTKKASQLGMTEAAEQGNARFSFTQGQPPQQGHQDHQQHVSFEQVSQMRQFESPQPGKGEGNYTAEMMMKKSQSIAAPQFLLAHQNSVTSSQTTDSARNNSNANFDGQGNDGQGGGNASFPIYLGKLPGNTQQQQAPPPPNDGIRTSPDPARKAQHARQRSKSMNTLQYYAQNSVSNVAKDPAQKLLHAAGVTGIQPVTARPSINGLNLTFRDMLDEGDGAEGDLNLRSRNQQWKDFRVFSDKFQNDNPMMQAAMAVDQDSPVKGETGSVGSASTASHVAEPLSGSKRTLTPSSLNSRNSASTAGTQGNRAFPHMVSGGGMPIAGSHRASVSVNDLAVLRRAAGRMKMNNPGSMGGMGMPRRQSQRLPGEMLGGGMLSRISSGSTSMGTEDSTSGGAALSPLAQMMAKNSVGAGGAGRSASGSSAGTGGGTGSFASDQQKELFMQKFQMAMNAHAGSPGGPGLGGQNDPALSPFGMQANSGMQGGMGRRSRTVGAGLAYGRAEMTMDYKSGFRLSRFNLGDLKKETSRLSEISSTGSSGGGRNEEWDLS